MTPEEKATLQAAQAILTRYRIASPAEGLVVSLAAHEPTRDCPESYSVGVLWNERVWSGHAVDFENAVGIARSKIAEEKDRLSKEASKRAKARPNGPIDRAHQEIAA